VLPYWPRLSHAAVQSHLFAAGFHRTGAAGAQRSSLFDSEPWSCPGGASDTAGATFGFVITNTSSDGKLLAEVSVEGGSPDATYSIWVNQDPGDCPTQPMVSLTTNRNGNGNAHAVEPRLPGATHFWVSAREEPFSPGKQILRGVAVPLN